METADDHGALVLGTPKVGAVMGVAAAAVVAAVAAVPRARKGLPIAGAAPPLAGLGATNTRWA